MASSQVRGLGNTSNGEIAMSRETNDEATGQTMPLFAPTHPPRDDEESLKYHGAIQAAIGTTHICYYFHLHILL